jgi:hypothetical protein
MKTPSDEYGIMPLSKAREGFQYRKDSEHIQSTTSFLSEDRVYKNCEEAWGRDPCKRVHELVPVPLNTVLSARRGGVTMGDLHWSGLLPRKAASSGYRRGAHQVYIVPRQHAPARGDVQSVVHERAEAGLHCGYGLGLQRLQYVLEEALCLSKFEGMVGRPGIVKRRSTVDRTVKPSNSGNWTADWMKEGNLDREKELKRRETQQPRDRSGRFRAVLDSSEGYWTMIEVCQLTVECETDTEPCMECTEMEAFIPCKETEVGDASVANAQDN